MRTFSRLKCFASGHKKGSEQGRERKKEKDEQRKGNEWRDETRETKEVFNSCVKPLKHDSKLLSILCGKGQLLVTLLERFSNCLGLIMYCCVPWPALPLFYLCVIVYVVS